MTPPTISLRLSEADRLRAEAIADAAGCTRHAVLVGALKAGLGLLFANAGQGRVQVVDLGEDIALLVRDPQPWTACAVADAIERNDHDPQ